MKQIAVLSGKGGTGKTTITSSLSDILDTNVLIDADIDCPDLDNFIDYNLVDEINMKGFGSSAKETEVCIGCMKCVEACRFNAINFNYNSRKAEVIDYLCRGCELCSYVCPVDAIYMKTNEGTDINIGKMEKGVFIFPGADNISLKISSKVITVLRKVAEEICIKSDVEYLIIDGPPGLGCNAVSSIVGVDYVILVIEPTLTSLYDFKRILTLIEYFKIKTLVVINKQGISDIIEEDIKKECNEKNIEIISEIPFREEIIDFTDENKYLHEFPDETVSSAVYDIAYKIEEIK